MGESPAFDDVEADPLFFRPRVFADFVDSPAYSYGTIVR